MTRRWRWLLFCTTAGAFAVGFVLSFSMLDSAPAAPENIVEVSDEPRADEPLCEDVNGMFVGVYGDELAIFEGTPDGCHRLVETKSISVRGLPAFQRTDLERGIVFSSEDELFQILEGLTAP